MRVIKSVLLRPRSEWSDADDPWEVPGGQEQSQVAVSSKKVVSLKLPVATIVVASGQSPRTVWIVPANTKARRRKNAHRAPLLPLSTPLWTNRHLQCDAPPPGRCVHVPQGATGVLETVGRLAN